MSHREVEFTPTTAISHTKDSVDMEQGHVPTTHPTEHSPLLCHSNPKKLKRLLSDDTDSVVIQVCLPRIVVIRM
jgi:hypothetical protein